MSAERTRATRNGTQPGFTRISCDIRDCRTTPIDADSAANGRRVGRLMGWYRDPIFKTDLCPSHADIGPGYRS